MTDDDLFDPLDGAWSRTSPSLATVRRLFGALPLIVVGLTAPTIGLVDAVPSWIPTTVGVVLVAIGLAVWVWADRNQRSWGYAENDDDLLITSGVMFRRLVAVPYGRMQFVDVQAGPIYRLFGIASITLHTASAKTAATIPGIERDEATRLRNRLTELGEARGAGV